jgi:hypothetical protein
MTNAGKPECKRKMNAVYARHLLLIRGVGVELEHMGGEG